MRDIVTNPWTQTYSGTIVDLLNPRPEQILLADIAHSLSMLCRFGGHTVNFYSVGQHSVLVSRIVSRENALWGLLHDAAESYLGDVARPLKLYLNGRYSDLEKGFMKVICDRFDLPYEEPEAVKVADKILLVTERRDLLLEQEEEWPYSEKPLKSRIQCWNPKMAEGVFISTYHRLCGERGWVA